MSKMNKGTSRRHFLKKTALGSAAWASTAPQVHAQDTADRLEVLAALGDTLIPSEEGKPGFKSLQPYGITAEVNKSLTALQDELFATFNQACAGFFKGRTFIGRGEPVARRDRQDCKIEATLVKNVPLVRFGSATG